ncbi:phosphate signaling complex protein PhoU [Intestinibacillus sp. Marseille-P6563]|uniref:phosphate signaling complex protein PhoU n=1 Tax=Intestinibacillus sp. Marseille-P6563 TaxID=2364792 RepID=UPI000F064F61|nr:phosphate signaling complex protein PhoU [Intestinibacillus sp. Marseille-P6563]
MRSRFEAQLHELNNEIITMGAMVESAIAAAARALENRDVALATQVAGSDSAVDTKEREIEQLCLKLLLQQQPVASDLRMISAAMKMITDIERIGDQAADIAELTLLLCQQEGLLSAKKLKDMARATIHMVSGAIDAFVRRDLHLAREICEYDDIVDRQFDEIKADLVDAIRENRDIGETAIDEIMIAKYFERIGDHAVNIAEWVDFSITGHLKHEG